MGSYDWMLALHVPSAGGISVRRLRDGGGTGLLRVSTLVAVLLVAAYVVTVWAMAGKPD